MSHYFSGRHPSCLSIDITPGTPLNDTHEFTTEVCKNRFVWKIYVYRHKMCDFNANFFGHE